MTTTSKASKRKGRESSLSSPSSPPSTLPLSASPGRLAGREPGDSTYQDWLTACMEAGQFCGVSWQAWERIFAQIRYDLQSNHALDPKGLTEDLTMLLRHFPYDPEMWAIGYFRCLKSKTDMNGRPPSIGIVRLPIDPFRRRDE